MTITHTVCNPASDESVSQHPFLKYPVKGSKPHTSKFSPNIFFSWEQILDLKLLKPEIFNENQTILSNGTFTILEDSQSARVFEGMANDIAEKNPEKILGWLTIQYEELVSICAN